MSPSATADWRAFARSPVALPRPVGEAFHAFLKKRHPKATPRRVDAAGVKAYTVYNHMLLPSFFRSVEEDYAHLKAAVQVWDVACERQVELAGPDARYLVQLSTPRDVSSGVLGSLWTRVRPAAVSQNTTSVKVPPTSMPINFIAQGSRSARRPYGRLEENNPESIGRTSSIPHVVTPGLVPPLTG